MAQIYSQNLLTHGTHASNDTNERAEVKRNDQTNHYQPSNQLQKQQLTTIRIYNKFIEFLCITMCITYPLHDSDKMRRKHVKLESTK